MIAVMRVNYEELMQKLGVGYELSPYETRPWFVYSEEKGITCSAEVRAGPGLSDLEAEIQFLYDEGCEPVIEAPQKEEEDPDAYRYKKFYEEEEEEDESGKTEGEGGGAGSHGMIPEGPQQIFLMRIVPAKDSLWKPVSMTVKGKDFVNTIAEWEEKGCDFFRTCIEALQMDELPDIDELIESELTESKGGRGKRGKIGKKSPTIKPASLLGMKP